MKKCKWSSIAKKVLSKEDIDVIGEKEAIRLINNILSESRDGVLFLDDLIGVSNNYRKILNKLIEKNWLFETTTNRGTIYHIHPLKQLWYCSFLLNPQPPKFKWISPINTNND
tara:strand:+ start:998 stop:1336 length:339 start_codon:yes stop_codon:yes gene_type:complete